MNADDIKTIAVSVIFLGTAGLYIAISLIFPGRQHGGSQ